MGSDNSIKVIIDKSEVGGIFTNNDVVRGQVEVTVPSSLSLKEINVSIEGTSNSTIEYSKGTGKNRTTVRVNNEHSQVYGRLLVFPPRDQRDNLSSKEHTLTDGVYIYPFSFHLPMNNECGEFSNNNSKCPPVYDRTRKHDSLNYFSAIQHNWFNNGGTQCLSHISRQMAPSFSYYHANVEYSVKAEVEVAAFYRSNHRDYRPFHFLPLDLPQPPNTGQIGHRDGIVIPKHLNKTGDFPNLSFELRRPALAQLIPNEGGIFRLHIVKPATFHEKMLPDIFLDSIRVRIICVTDIRAVRSSWNNTMHMRQDTDKKALKFVNLDLMRLELKTMEWTQEDNLSSTEIPHDIYNFEFPSSFPPSFETCNISRSYYLEVTIAYAFDADARGGFRGLFLLNRIRKAVILTTEVVVGSGLTLRNRENAAHTHPRVASMDLKPSESKIPTQETTSNMPIESLPQYKE